jgi:hypothetical protein
MAGYDGDHTTRWHENQARAVAADLRTDLIRASVLRYGVLLTTAYLLLWGTAALAVRFATGEDHARWWLGAIGIALMWGIAGFMAWRDRPSVDQARAMVDGRRRLGGLLMAEQMDGFEAWSDKLASPKALRVKWRGGPACAALGASAIFLLGGMFAPMPDWNNVAAGMNVQRTIDALEDQVQVLEEERILDEPQAQALRDDMARVAEDARGADPSRTWEALDHVAEQLKKEAAEAADDALRKMTESAAAQNLAKALESGSDQLSPQQLSQAMEALAQLTKEAVGGDMAAALSPEMAEALSQAATAGLSAEMLNKLAEMMGECNGDLQAMLEALENAGLINGKLSDIPYEFDPEALVEWLACQGEGECDAAKICKACKGGRGGINRGPGHVEMLWKDPSSKEGANFEPQVLPPTRMQDMKDARLLGVTRGAPDTEPAGDGSTGGALAGATTTGGSAQSQVILPRHRGAVQRYFQRSDYKVEGGESGDNAGANPGDIPGDGPAPE